jgi:hypothetical protein
LQRINIVGSPKKSPIRRALSVDYHYVTKRDVTPNADCETSAKKVTEIVKKHFPGAQVGFQFVGASQLWKQLQTPPPKSNKLKWASQSLSTPEGQIGLVRLPDYFSFVTEDDGQLAERFFDSNVRGYWKTSVINKRIASTLLESTEFRPTGLHQVRQSAWSGVSTRY